MSTADYAKALTDFWSAQGKAMLDAQQQAARAMTDGMQAMLAGKVPAAPASAPELGALAADMQHAGDSVLQLWTAASSMFTELSAKLGHDAKGGEGDLVASVFGRIADPRQWVSGSGDMEEALTRMADAPRLADLFDLERRSARVMQAWMQVRRRTLEHQAVVLEAWLRAGRRYMEEAAGHASADNKPIEPKRALALWTEVANRVLIETQRSEPFLASQREMIRSTTELRLAQQDLVERFGSQYGFPTRTELDDVHRSLTEMRRELRRMRRALQEAQVATSAATAATTAPVPQSPRNSKRKVKP